MASSKPTDSEGGAAEYVAIPRELLEQLDVITDEGLRVLLGLLMEENRTGIPGTTVAVGELAEKCGLNLARTRLAAMRLAEVNWVAEASADVFHILWEPPPGMAGPARGSQER
jgi:hypothetical protein